MWPRWDSNPHAFWALDFESSASAIPPLGRAVTKIDPPAHDGKVRLPLARIAAKVRNSGWLFHPPVGRMGICPTVRHE